MVDIDRRDLLRRTAAAGAAAWVAPTVLATSAVAAEDVCTPRCQPASPQANVDLLVDSYCPRSGNKAARVNLRLSATAPPCPCTESLPRLCRGVVPRLWEKDGTQQLVVIGRTDPEPGYDLAFFVAKLNGALGNGTWAPSTPIRVYLQCEDRTGDVLTSYCDYRPSFVFSDQGPCGRVNSYQPGLVSCGFEDCDFTPAVCTS